MDQRAVMRLWTFRCSAVGGRPATSMGGFATKPRARGAMPAFRPKCPQHKGEEHFGQPVSLAAG